MKWVGRSGHAGVATAHGPSTPIDDVPSTSPRRRARGRRRRRRGRSHLREASASRWPPHLVGGLARPRDHAGHEDEPIRAGSLGDDGRDVPPVRLADDDELVWVVRCPDGIDDDLGVVLERGVVVIDRQVGCDRRMAARSELTLDEMPSTSRRRPRRGPGRTCPSAGLAARSGPGSAAIL
jgi:hypothetical protein